MKGPKGQILIIGGAEYKDDGRYLPMVDFNREAVPWLLKPDSSYYNQRDSFLLEERKFLPENFINK